MLVIVLIAVFLPSLVDGQANGLFDVESDCTAKCVGIRDSECMKSLANGNTKFYCRCRPGYYNSQDQCYNECEYQQFWSLFTYGACVNVSTTPALAAFTGQCNTICAFRVRVWATVFVIILFVSAVTLLILMLPGFVTSCYTCCFLQKQKRRTEEDVAIQAISGADPHGTVVKPGSQAGYQHQQMPAQQGWGYGWGWPYYGR